MLYKLKIKFFFLLFSIFFSIIRRKFLLNFALHDPCLVYICEVRKSILPTILSLRMKRISREMIRYIHKIAYAEMKTEGEGDWKSHICVDSCRREIM